MRPVHFVGSYYPQSAEKKYHAHNWKNYRTTLNMHSKTLCVNDYEDLNPPSYCIFLSWILKTAIILSYLPVFAGVVEPQEPRRSEHHLRAVRGVLPWHLQVRRPEPQLQDGRPRSIRHQTGEQWYGLEQHLSFNFISSGKHLFFLTKCSNSMGKKSAFEMLQAYLT